MPSWPPCRRSPLRHKATPSWSRARRTARQSGAWTRSRRRVSPCCRIALRRGREARPIMAEAEQAPPLKRTPLFDLHVARGARMVPFAGYEMPVQYPSGIIKEHLHTRAAAGLFDVSHMGQIVLRPRSGYIADAARALEALVPADILGLAEGRQRYALFTNSAG